MKTASRASAAAAVLVVGLLQHAAAVRLGELEEDGQAGNALMFSSRSANMLAYNVKLMDKVRARIKEIVFNGSKLLVPDQILKALDGGKGDKCSHWEDYTTDNMGDKEWQCANTNWIYDPPGYIRTYLQRFVGNSNITEGETRPELNAPGSGLWCGNMDYDPSSKNARIYWASCAAMGGGYFNALRCKNDGVYAVIGMAAADRNMCYPAHTQSNEEAYWPVAGQATWRKWGSDGNENEKEVGAGRPHFFSHGSTHELETGENDGVLSIYWWAMPSNSSRPERKSPNHIQVQDDSCWYRHCQKCGVPDDGEPSCSKPEDTDDEDLDDGEDYEPPTLRFSRLRYNYADGPLTFTHMDYEDDDDDDDDDAFDDDDDDGGANSSTSSTSPVPPSIIMDGTQTDRQTDRGKAAGPDDVPPEFWKTLDGSPTLQPTLGPTLQPDLGVNSMLQGAPGLAPAPGYQRMSVFTWPGNDAAAAEPDLWPG